MLSKNFFNCALAGRMAAGLLSAFLLAGCYAYPAGYQAYGGYPVAGAYQGYPYYEGYPYYGAYPGSVFIGVDGDRRGRPGYFGNGRPGGFSHGFQGRPGPGFSHGGVRPGGFGSGFHGGGAFFSHH
jgi:hypothetical protein